MLEIPKALTTINLVTILNIYLHHSFVLPNNVELNGQSAGNQRTYVQIESSETTCEKIYIHLI